jgi:hypothetical protein
MILGLLLFGLTGLVALLILAALLVLIGLLILLTALIAAATLLLVLVVLAGFVDHETTPSRRQMVAHTEPTVRVRLCSSLQIYIRLKAAAVGETRITLR